MNRKPEAPRNRSLLWFVALSMLMALTLAAVGYSHRSSVAAFDEKQSATQVEIEAALGGGAAVKSTSTKNVSVTIFGSSSFDATTVIPKSLSFKDAVSLEGTVGANGVSVKDVNQDKYPDLIAEFSLERINEEPTKMILEGATLGGTLIRGSTCIQASGAPCGGTTLGAPTQLIESSPSAPAADCSENFDAVMAPALPAGWSATVGATCANTARWVTVGTTSDTAPNSAFVNDPNCISDERLDSPAFPIISATAVLTFRRNNNLESGFDGMVLEISNPAVNAGAFQDIITAGGSFVVGGYNATISVNFGSPIAGRQAWSGNSGGFVTTTVNLPASANGQSIVLRWRRGADSSVGAVGAFIDTISIAGSDCGACTITCPANITVSNDPNQCGAVVNYPAPTSTGACQAITCDPPSGSFFPVGTTTVTCTATGLPTTVTTVYSSGNIAVPIPDNDPTGATVTINVPDTGTLTDVNVRIRVDHTSDSNLAILLSSSGCACGVALSNNRGGSGDNYGTGTNDCAGTKTVFDDAAATPIAAGTAPFAGSFMPESGLSIFNGSTNNGTWSLTIVDSVNLDTGTIGCVELETTRQVFAAATSCSFTITVNDTQPPVITCPANVTTVTNQSCGAQACQTVNFPAPVASDNCPGVTVLCNPPSGSCFPTGTTTVTCTATDASGNTATCSFTISTFDVALQDDSDPSIILLWNSLTGAYRFCCNGITFTGVGKSTIQGCVFTLQHTPADRRVLGRVDKAVHAGTASIQFPVGTTRCTITDRNTLNDTLLPACQ